MYERISSKVEEFTKRRSETFLLLNTFSGQRPRNRKHVTLLANAMKDHTFRRGEVSVAHIGNQEILMNGQHQLQASVESGVTFTAALDRYKCEDEQDLWRLFATFDVHKPRTATDVMRAAKPLFANELLHAVPLRILSTCGSALLYLGDGTKPNFGFGELVSRAMRAELVEKYAEDALFVNSFATDDGIKLLRTAVVTAIIVTRRIDADKSKEFWERVIVGDRLEKGTPQFKLNAAIRDGISTTRFSAGRSMPTMYGTCIHWWNSYVTGQPRKLIRTSRISKEMPDAVAPRSANGRVALVLKEN